MVQSQGKQQTAPKGTQNQQPYSLLGLCTGWGKLTAIISLGFIAFVLACFFILSVINKTPAYILLFASIFFVLMIMLNNYLYNQYPRFMCFLLIFNIVIGSSGFYTLVAMIRSKTTKT